jgi:hypothetical protein
VVDGAVAAVAASQAVVTYQSSEGFLQKRKDFTQATKQLYDDMRETVSTPRPLRLQSRSDSAMAAE